MTKAVFQPPQLRIQEQELEERRATWLELFFDLVFIVAIAQLAHDLNEHFNPSGLISFAVLFIPVWWCWIGATFYDTRFSNDGLVDRLITLLQMAIIAVMAANIHHGLDSTSVGFAYSYIAFRTVLVCQYLHAGYHLPEARSLTNWFAVGFSGSIILWLLSTFVPIPWRFFLWGVGLIIDFATPLTAGEELLEFLPVCHTLPRELGCLPLSFWENL